MRTMIDLFELTEPVVETYRDSYRACVVTPRESMDFSIDCEDPTVRYPAPSARSERHLRARLWGTED